MSSTLKTTLPFDAAADLITFLNAFPLPALLLNRNSLEVVAFNNHAGDLYGWDAASKTTRFFPDLFHENNRIHLLRELQSATEKIIARSASVIHSQETVQLEIHAAPFEKDGASYLMVSLLDRNLHAEMEEELRKYRTFIDNSTEGIFCQEFVKPVSVQLSPLDIIEQVKGNCFITECNPAMAAMYGFEKPDELIGAPLEQLFDFADPAIIEYFVYFITNGFRVLNTESQEMDRDGNGKYFLNNAIGIVEDGFLKRIWGTQQDITSRKEIEHKLKLLANLVDQTSGILTAADLNLRPVTWNRAAEEIYGISESQALGDAFAKNLSIHYAGSSRDEIRRKLNADGEWRGEAYFIRSTDHKTVWLLIGFKAMHDDNGVQIGYVVSATDITDRKESESKLSESETRFRTMADSSPVMIWMSDENRKVSYLNQKWIDFTGKNIIGEPGVSWRQFIHKDDLANATAIFHKAHQTRQQVTVVYRMLAQDGRYHWVHDVSVPRFLADGTFVGYIGSIVDIQNQKEKEQQLQHQAMILETISDIIVTTDLDFRISSLNSVAEFYYGISEEDAKNQKLTTLIKFEFYDSDLPEVVRQLHNNDAWSGEASFKTKQGDVKYFHFSLKAIYDDNGNKIGYLSTGKDVTEKKLANDKMIASERFYRNLIANSLDGMILMDQEGLITFSSPSVLSVLGYDTEEVVGLSGFQFVHPEDLLWAAQSFEKEVTENPEVKYIVIRLKKKTGEWIWCRVRGHNLLNNPSIGSIVVYFHDDTLRKEASDALKESEKKFRSLIRDLHVGVFLVDHLGSFLLCNSALSTLFSVPEDYILGKSIYDLLSEDMVNEKGEWIPIPDRPLTLALQLKQPVKDYVIGILHPITRQRCWLMVNADPILDEHDALKHVICSVMDLTERKKLEHQLVTEQLLHSRKLTQATIDGQEAERKEIGKELHDNIGQQLTTIKLFLDLAKTTADPNAQDMIGMALKGVADVINEIRAMSRSLIPSTLQDLGLIESLGELVDSIERTQVISIQLECSGFDENLLQNNEQLAIYRIVQEQLNNIVKHADASLVTILLRKIDNRTELQISDNGCGFDVTRYRRGLGFINIRNRTELLGGKMEITSSPGKGCLLTVCLPLTRTVNDGIVALN